jgi:hypothetical protein
MRSAAAAEALAAANDEPDREAWPPHLAGRGILRENAAVQRSPRPGVANTADRAVRPHDPRSGPAQPHPAHVGDAAPQGRRRRWRRWRWRRGWRSGWWRRWGWRRRWRTDLAECLHDRRRLIIVREAAGGERHASDERTGRERARHGHGAEHGPRIHGRVVLVQRAGGRRLQEKRVAPAPHVQPARVGAAGRHVRRLRQGRRRPHVFVATW